jgi:hypothetical protein
MPEYEFGGLYMTSKGGFNEADEIRLIGCCGGYCKTCPALIEGFCKGCKLGYDDGTRDITKAKCPMKVCCIGNKGLDTCADCPEYDACATIGGFQSKNGYKYKKYRESLEFIRANGYAEFVNRSKDWKRAFGKL